VADEPAESTGMVEMTQVGRKQIEPAESEEESKENPEE